jgi:hypothetical protein
MLHRHYNPPRPYREAEFNMYAVLKSDTSAVRYVEMAGLAECSVRVPHPCRVLCDRVGILILCGILVKSVTVSSRYYARGLSGRYPPTIYV